MAVRLLVVDPACTHGLGTTGFEAERTAAERLSLINSMQHADPQQLVYVFPASLSYVFPEGCLSGQGNVDVSQTCLPCEAP